MSFGAGSGLSLRQQLVADLTTEADIQAEIETAKLSPFYSSASRCMVD